MPGTPLRVTWFHCHELHWVGFGVSAGPIATNYIDDVSYDIVRNPPQAKEVGYWLADASVGLGSNDDRWKLTAWVKNLADERYRT
jgi:outer membrane receptor protein involved in Fe transport